MIEANIFTEKRANPRVVVKLPVKYRMLEDKTEIKSIVQMKNKDQSGQTIDVSLGGMYIVSEKALDVGVMLRIDISLQDHKKPITAFAEVVWANETGGGLRFLTIKDEDIASLRAFLDNMSYPSGG